ncbi:hypothetical protein [Profundibacterium mesophilum]|uniref:hypothetical protein n=1 Tax=Profundibacterium mesophilum TaxID=1258573 RepID=UPI00135A4E27|nr:hypothetical protein [Profundibacterium mesophilum]
MTSTFVQVSKTDTEKSLQDATKSSTDAAQSSTDAASESVSAASTSGGGLGASETGRVRADTSVSRSDATRGTLGEMRRPDTDQVSAERAAAQASVDKMKKELLVAQIAKAPEPGIELEMVAPVEASSKAAYAEGKSAPATRAASEPDGERIDARA